MEVTILIRGKEKAEVYHGVDLIRDGGTYLHIHGFYQGEIFSRTWSKYNIIFIDVLFFA